jgi:serine/threonine protein kinase
LSWGAQGLLILLAIGNAPRRVDDTPIIAVNFASAVSLTSGTRLGPYEINVQIGVGGMGEVYRATDTNLNRAVAIKVLPESFASDGERLARFQREAQVLASLSHHNIASIYGLERAEGTTALVMELVEGPTLADRIAQGPIPLEEALSIATQIADALASAHEQRIIHRDLKPSNVKLRPDGMVKVLDFGLAKAMDASPAAGSNVSMSPTITTPAMTQLGLILGTAAYMSPEQARGKSVDRRADIWAFGCVLFEMLSSRRAFDAEDVSLTLARVLEREVDLTPLPSEVPPRVRQVLALCLRKDVGQRISDIHDVRLALGRRIRYDVGSHSCDDVAALNTSAVWSTDHRCSGGASCCSRTGVRSFSRNAGRTTSREFPNVGAGEIRDRRLRVVSRRAVRRLCHQRRNIEVVGAPHRLDRRAGAARHRRSEAASGSGVLVT